MKTPEGSIIIKIPEKASLMGVFKVLVARFADVMFCREDNERIPYNLRQEIMGIVKMDGYRMKTLTVGCFNDHLLFDKIDLLEKISAEFTAGKVRASFLSWHSQLRIDLGLKTRDDLQKFVESFKSKYLEKTDKSSENSSPSELSLRQAKLAEIEGRVASVYGLITTPYSTMVNVIGSGLFRLNGWLDRSNNNPTPLLDGFYTELVRASEIEVTFLEAHYHSFVKFVTSSI